MKRWPNKYVIGLTGDLAAGKSTVREILQDLGALGIDANTLAYRLICEGAPGYERLVKIFGELIFDAQGQIDYERLADMINTNPRAEERLLEIVEPMVSQTVDLIIRQAEEYVIVIESTHLLEFDLAMDCEAIWEVYTPVEQRVSRLMCEDALSETAARHRIEARSPEDTKLRSADVVIDNAGSIEQTRQEVDAALSRIDKVKVVDGALIAVAAAEEISLSPNRSRSVEKINRSSLDQLSVEKPRSPLADVWYTFKRNKVAMFSVVVLALIVLMAIFAPWITPYDYDIRNLSRMYTPPLGAVTATEKILEECHWAGTFLEPGCSIHLAGSDRMGRDIWSMTIYGTRVSLSVALVAACTSFLIGTFIGTISGYTGGRLDEGIMRFVDFLYSLPIFMVVVVMQFFFRSFHWTRYGSRVDTFIANLDIALGGLLFIFLAIGGLSWVDTARMARGQVYAYKKSEFVEAARVIGATDERIIVRHLLPNVIGSILVVETLAIPGYIFLEAALSFLGVGVIPPTPSWGLMIGNGYSGLRSHPHLVLLPSIAIILLTLSFNFIGDGLRDAFDTTLRGKV